MSKREEFIAAINILRAASQSITPELRKGLLRQAVQEQGLSVDEASEILNASGLIVGERVNYFEVLGFSIEEFENQSEGTIATLVDVAHNKFYTESLRAGGLPRPDGRTQEQWRTLLNQARDTLKDPQKRGEHIGTLQIEIQQPVDPISEEEFLSPEQASIRVAVPENTVLVPAGEFQMGNNNEMGSDRERPVHAVYIDAFYMDKYPVTNAQYKVFIDANQHWGKQPSHWGKQNRMKKMMLSIFRKYHGVDYLKYWNGNEFPRGKADHPVTYVSWHAAMAYAQWAGKRLPSEAEWEKAARGEKIGQKYPWGDFLDPNKAYCGENVGETVSVGKYPANDYGLFDMVGNVWEWCLDEYKADFYSSSPDRNPVAGINIKEDLDSLIFNFREIKTDRVLRGGPLFTSSEPIYTAARWGGSPVITSYLASSPSKVAFLSSSRLMANIGFRCVRDAQLKLE